MGETRGDLQGGEGDGTPDSRGGKTQLKSNNLIGGKDEDCGTQHDILPRKMVVAVLEMMRLSVGLHLLFRCYLLSHGVAARWEGWDQGKGLKCGAATWIASWCPRTALARMIKKKKKKHGGGGRSHRRMGRNSFDNVGQTAICLFD